MKTFILFSLIIAFSIPVASQDDMRQAFGKSYGLEKEAKYKEAVNALLPFYNQDAYEINLRLGWLSFKAGQHTEALKYYERCRKIMPMSIEARLGYTLPAAALEHWDQVLTSYLEILKIDPNQTTALYQAGLIYYNRKDYSTADRHFSKLINLYPFDYYGLLMMGWTRLQQARTNEAKVLFNKVLLYDPTDASAHEGLKLIK